MVWALVLGVLALGVLALGAWGLLSLQREQETSEPLGRVRAQDLSALAQPYRRYLGEAVSIQQDIGKQAHGAPQTLQYELTQLAQRVEHLVSRALPRAQYGTRLAAQLLELSPSEAQYAKTQSAAQEVETDLQAFVETLTTLRAKVYQVLSDVANLGADQQLTRDLDDALTEVSALEEAFREVSTEL